MADTGTDVPAPPGADISKADLVQLTVKLQRKLKAVEARAQQVAKAYKAMLSDKQKLWRCLQSHLNDGSIGDEPKRLGEFQSAIESMAAVAAQHAAAASARAPKPPRMSVVITAAALTGTRPRHRRGKTTRQRAMAPMGLMTAALTSTAWTLPLLLPPSWRS